MPISLVTKGLHGLCKEVSLAVLPRLHMEEVMLELRRRKIEVTSEGIDKHDLVTFLHNLMILEYSEADGSGQESTCTAVSGNPVCTLPQQDSGETHEEVIITSEELVDSAPQEHGQEICMKSAEESANQLCATPQPQITNDMQTNIENTNKERSVVDEFNISGSTNMMNTTTSTDKVPAGNTANFATIQHLATSPAKPSVPKARDHTSTERGLSESKVRSEPVTTVRPSYVLNFAQGCLQKVPAIEVPMATDTTCPATYVRMGQNSQKKKGMIEKNESGDMMEREIGGDSDDCGDEDILQEDEEAAQDPVSWCTPANEESSSEVHQKEDNQAAVAPSDQSSPKDRHPHRKHPGDRSKQLSKPCLLDQHNNTHTGEKPYNGEECSRQLSDLSSMQKHKIHHTRKRSYKCGECSSQFSTPNDLKKHMCTPTKEKVYKCKKCSKEFIDRKLLQQHKLTHKGEKPYKCDQCSRQFSGKGHLKRHKQINHTGTKKKPYTCEECYRQFSRKCHLTRHRQSHTREKPYTCEECSRQFSWKGHLKRHKQTIHAREKHYTCEECNRQFSKKGNLKKHLYTHTGEKPYRCEVCSKQFNSKANLRLHMRIHTEKPYVLRRHICEECSIHFETAFALKTHKRTHTGEKPYKCEECSKQFSRLSNMKRHKQIHTGEKPYVCEKCGSQFRYLYSLKTHLKTHTISNEKPYSCETCKKQFYCPHRLKDHRMIHTGKKPYMCDKCSRQFLRKNDLQHHFLRIHAEEKPYKCGECSRQFSKPSDLTRHEVTHGEKPFVCEECCKAFHHLVALTLHRRIHTGEKPYRCELCNWPFSRQKCLTRHMKMKHGSQDSRSAGHMNMKQGFQDSGSSMEHGSQESGNAAASLLQLIGESETVPLDDALLII